MTEEEKKNYMKEYNRMYKKKHPEKRDEYEKKRREFRKTPEGKEELKKQYEKQKERERINGKRVKSEEELAKCKIRSYEFRKNFKNENGISYSSWYKLNPENKERIKQTRKKRLDKSNPENRERIKKFKKSKSDSERKRRINMTDNQKEKQREYQRKRYWLNVEKSREKNRYEYLKRGKDKNREYYNKVREERNEKRKIYRRKIKEERPDIYFKEIVRTVIRQAILNKGFKKPSTTEDMLGCSLDFFKSYIELKFEKWMTWGNYGVYTGNYNETWQLDHIIPMATAKSLEDVKMLNHYTNLRPLCSRVNLEKRDLIIENIAA